MLLVEIFCMLIGDVLNNFDILFSWKFQVETESCTWSAFLIWFQRRLERKIRSYVWWRQAGGCQARVEKGVIFSCVHFVSVLSTNVLFFLSSFQNFLQSGFSSSSNPGFSLAFKKSGCVVEGGKFSCSGPLHSWNGLVDRNDRVYEAFWQIFLNVFTGFLERIDVLFLT